MCSEIKAKISVTRLCWPWNTSLLHTVLVQKIRQRRRTKNTVRDWKLSYRKTNEISCLFLSTTVAPKPQEKRLDSYALQRFSRDRVRPATVLKSLSFRLRELHRWTALSPELSCSPPTQHMTKLSGPHPLTVSDSITILIVSKTYQGDFNISLLKNDL